MKNLFKILTVLIVVFLPFRNAFPQEEHVEIGIDEKLGEYLPSTAKFKNSAGNEVILQDVINKPTLLAFVYYECPGICSNTLSELAWVVDRVNLEPGKEFKVVTISIDHEETPQIAKIAKENYLTSLKRKFPEDAWEFLTADSITISEVTKTAGVFFKKYGDEYRHPGGLLTISPDRKISRYIFGSQFNQFDVKMALLDAQAGKTSPTVAKLLQFCFSYDPEGRSYTLNITRIIGSLMLIGVFGFFLVLVLKKKKIN
ncbi:MAG: SCO family protein [Ignavibacteriae bacterium]|nr:SCO family protein [Ignavibacteriota bacterium]MCB9209711.1 SCO family protein [Ignavibacteriales bacterium]